MKEFKNSEKHNLKHIYKNELYNACFSHDTPYSDSKDLPKRTVSDIVLKDKAYEIAINPKYEWNQRGLANMVYKFFDKQTGSGTSVNEELA